MKTHLFVNTLGQTEEFKSEDFSQEVKENCKVVYAKKDDGYYFHSLWNPDKDDQLEEDRHIIVPLHSVYGGTFNYTKNDVFSNVIGSSVDKYTPDKSKSWIQLFRDKNIPCDCCVMDNTFYDSNDKSGSTYFIDYHCNGSIVGGHVINDFDAKDVSANSIVYLLPICHAHNSCCTDNTGRNGSGFFMMPEKDGKGIILRSYLTL